MKAVLIIFFLIISLPAPAGEIVLLTSLKLSKLSKWHIEKNFRKTFKKSEHSLAIRHKAGPKELYRFLSSEKTVALIWVSHADSEQELGHGYKASDIILDIWGNDVKNFFTLIPANLKFLGIVGCKANQIIEGLRSRGNYINYPDLKIKSFDKKVRLSKAFKETLKSAVISLETEVNHEKSFKSEVTLNLSRTSLASQEGLHAGWVEVGDQILTFFEEHETQQRSSTIPYFIWDKLKNKNIRFKRLKNGINSKESLGELDARSDQTPGIWKLFAREGRPIGGLDEQLYIFKQI